VTVLLFAAIPYVIVALIGIGIAYLLTKRRLEPWILLYLAIPLTVWIAGISFGYTRRLVGSLGGPTISICTIPIAVICGIDASQRRCGPIYHSLVVVGIETASLLLMILLRDIGEC